MNVQFLGNKELLKLKKTAFLASSTISSETVLKCYDWATEMRRHGECVISGFSSKLEQDVLHFLLKGTQLIIIPAELQAPMEQNRLLIISVSNATRQSRTTALARNRYICEISERILFVGVTESSSLNILKTTFENKLLASDIQTKGMRT